MSRRAQNSKVKKRNRPRPDPPAPLSAWTASINWGDGSPVSAGTITQPGGAGTNLVVSGSHTYSDEGNLQVTATVMESGSTAMAMAQVSATVSEADVLTAPSLSTSLVSLWKAEGNANDSA